MLHLFSFAQLQKNFNEHDDTFFSSKKISVFFVENSWVHDKVYINFHVQAISFFVENLLVHLLFVMIDFQYLLKANLMILANPDAYVTTFVNNIFWFLKNLFKFPS